MLYRRLGGDCALQFAIDVVVDDIPLDGISATDRIAVTVTSSTGNPDHLLVRSKLCHAKVSGSNHSAIPVRLRFFTAPGHNAGKRASSFLWLANAAFNLFVLQIISIYLTIYL